MAEDLFVRPDGKPMTFLMGSSQEKKEVKSLVEERGGVVVAHASPSTADHLIRLVAGGEMPPSRRYDLFHYKYILKCVEENQILPDLSAYKQASTYPLPFASYDPIDILLGKVCWGDVPVSGEAISDVEEDFEEETSAATSNKVFKTTRSPYTPSERAEIVEGLVNRKAFGMLKGNAVWKLMEKEGVCGGRRSWQSLKEQFKKVIAPAIDSYGLEPKDLDQFRAVLVESDSKSTEKMAETSRYPVVSEGGSRRKSRERREPPASPSTTPGASGWIGRSSIPPQIPGNPRLSLTEARCESPNKRKRGKSAKKGSEDGYVTAKQGSEDGYVTASQEEGEPIENHFYDIVPKESTPKRSLRKEASSAQLSPKASGSGSRGQKTPKTDAQHSTSPKPTGSVAIVLEKTKRRPARSNTSVESVPRRKLRRKSKVGEVFAETPVKATSSADESETISANADDTDLSSQEVTVVGDGVAFDSERIVQDEIDTASPGAEHSVKNTSQGPKASEDNKSGKKRSGSKRSQVQDKPVDGEQGCEDDVGKKAAAVKAKKRKTDGRKAKKKDRVRRIVIGEDEEGEEENKEDEEEEDWLEAVKKSPKKKTSVKKETKVRGRGMFRQPYSRQEESSVVNYLLEKGGLSLISGLKLWQDMEEAEICPGRSAHALKEQYLHHIRKRLHEFDVTEEQLREADVRAETLNAYINHNETLGSSPTGRGFRAKANYYVTEEDLKILNFILDNGRSADTGGVALWQLMELRNVVEGRSWQSLKERFRRSILKRLDSFGNLTAEQKQRLLVGGGVDRGKGGRKKKDQRSKKIVTECESCGIPGCKTCE